MGAQYDIGGYLAGCGTPNHTMACHICHLFSLTHTVRYGESCMKKNVLARIKTKTSRLLLAWRTSWCAWCGVGIRPSFVFYGMGWDARYFFGFKRVEEHVFVGIPFRAINKHQHQHQHQVWVRTYQRQCVSNGHNDSMQVKRKAGLSRRLPCRSELDKPPCLTVRCSR